MRSVLIATRGALAVRAVESCLALGLVPVTVVARSDPQRKHATRAGSTVVLDDRHCDDSYNCVDCVVRAAVQSQVDTVYPGWGPLAENPLLDERLAALGIRWVGAPANALSAARNKGVAVAAAERIGVPVLPHALGWSGINALIAEHGFPVVLKPADGYQGNDVLVATNVDNLPVDLTESSTGWYAESYIESARVVGVTIAIDDAGAVVLLGERESLLLASHRKLVEAAPVIDVAAPLMRAMRRDATRLAIELGLRNVVTVEFLVHRGYTFLEVNPRLTGAYRICEAQARTDLIAIQLNLAAGRRFDPAWLTLDPALHVVQAHIYLCRDAMSGERWLAEVNLPPPQTGVLVECTLDEHRPLVYDTLAAQVLASGHSRTAAAARVIRAIAATRIAGVHHHGSDIVGWWNRGDMRDRQR